MSFRRPRLHDYVQLPAPSKGGRVGRVECGRCKLPWQLVKEISSWTDGRDSRRTQGPGGGQVGKLLGKTIRLALGRPVSPSGSEA